MPGDSGNPAADAPALLVLVARSAPYLSKCLLHDLFGFGPTGKKAQSNSHHPRREPVIDEAKRMPVAGGNAVHPLDFPASGVGVWAGAVRCEIGLHGRKMPPRGYRSADRR